MVVGSRRSKKEVAVKYDISTFVGGKTIEFMKDIPDPFVRHVIYIGWKDLLRGLWRRGLEVQITVSGDKEAIQKVMRNDQL